jgi:hypothetical protein
MRLDHISYVASHDQISDVVNRIGSQIGTAFVDGGIHPKFGTRNFIAPLLNNQYLEVVCPMDHPATDSSPFGQIVKKKVRDGGGWLTWVIATTDIKSIELKMQRKAVDAIRKKPDGTELKWKQIGVLAALENYQLPFYIQWLDGSHPSESGKKIASIQEIEIMGDRSKLNALFDLEELSNFDEIEFLWKDQKHSSELSGIQSVTFRIGNKTVRIQ